MLLSLLQRLLALVSLAFIIVAGYLGWSWWRLHEALDRLPPDTPRDPQDWRLWVAGALAAWWLLGRLPMGWLLGRPGKDGDRLKPLAGVYVETADGARLHMTCEGASDAPVLLFIHGWGLEGGMWWEARRMLSSRYQVVTYDLAGLGRSRSPADGHYSLERLADHLKAVVDAIPARQVVLVGHSIGGMIVQTFCLRHAESLGGKVVGAVLENTTHIDPSRTTVLGRALHAIKPLVVAGMYPDIWLQPLFWALNWQAYLSGSTHVAMRLGGFGTQPTRAQLNQVALDATRNPPAVQAKGNLAMMAWGVTDQLSRIAIPILVFIGGRDLVTRPSAGRTIAERLPAARAEFVPLAGHMGPVECAQTYNDAIAAFADEVCLRGARPADRMGAPSAARRPVAGRRGNAGKPGPSIGPVG